MLNVMRRVFQNRVELSGMAYRCLEPFDGLGGVVMSTSQEFPGHRKPGHYEPRTAVSRDFPRDPEGPVPVRNTQ